MNIIHSFPYQEKFLPGANKSGFESVIKRPYPIPITSKYKVLIDRYGFAMLTDRLYPKIF